jgi:gluconolactonase
MDVDFFTPAMREVADPDPSLTRVVSEIGFGEGPVWDHRTQSLFFVDIIGSNIWRWTPGVGKEIVLSKACHPDGMTFDREGRLIVAGWSSRTVYRREKDGSWVTIASHYQGKKINTPNDIVVKSDGAVYWTDPDGALFIPGKEGEDQQRYRDFTGVLRLSPDGSEIRPATEEGTSPNGLAFSPDEKLLYVNDTRQHHIRVYDVGGDGILGNGRLFYKLQGEEPGHADGMKVDVVGNVYCTGPAGIHVVSPDGTLIGRLRTPEPATNLCWGDDDWRSLYITTVPAVYRTRLKISGVAVW